MKIILLLTFLLIFPYAQAALCPKPWTCSLDEMHVPYSVLKIKKEAKVLIRSGYLPHKSEFKGNILYLEGLGDSMLNHAPLFEKLSSNGYQVIAFDYMGQGGSSGSMNNTRLQVIADMGKLILDKWTIHQGPTIILGWSTGGLAAYLATEKYKIDRLILIAPGIVPNLIVGEGLSQWPLNKISMETLTSDDYKKNSNPHIDKIRPSSPLLVLNFSFDLITSSYVARGMEMNKKVKGLVLLSGENDNYVNAKMTFEVITKNAPHFSIKNYPEALHEIDNERAPIREKAYQDILNFLNE
jgi:alpha-beta hydrolase superfamily lysophospholipase